MEINHEKLKSKFVNFDGKKKLVVRNDSFVKGDPNNNWPEIFPQFSDQIKNNIGVQNHTNLMPKFSTTTPTS